MAFFFKPNRQFFLLCTLILSTYACAYEIVAETPETKSLGYGDWLIHTDGELALMQQLIRPQDIVFDVGANVGDWSMYALSLNRPIHLYAFEPVPIVFSDL